MKPRIFFASSGRAKLLALELADKLNARAKVDNVSIERALWWETILPGESTLFGLIDECKKSHFAAVLLTEEDITLKKGEEVAAPRDNCVFELGLFTGALGLEPKRCFIITSAKKDALPSDLDGITFVPILDLQDGKITEDVSESLDTAAKTILKVIRKLGLYDRPQVPIVSDEGLMEYEKLEREHGHLLQGSRVLISSKQPIETSSPFATRVHTNITEDIRYRYFFHADVRAKAVIAQLIWELGTVGVKGTTLPEKKKGMEEDKKKVSENLETIQQSLGIYFLSQAPPFHLCIHNSDRVEHARCYLRYPDENQPPRFVDWCRGEKAKALADDLLDMRKEDGTACVFQSTKDFDLRVEGKSFATKLRQAVVAKFPALFEEKVGEVCFGK